MFSTGWRIYAIKKKKYPTILNKKETLWSIFVMLTIFPQQNITVWLSEQLRNPCTQIVLDVINPLLCKKK